MGYPTQVRLRDELGKLTDAQFYAQYKSGELLNLDEMTAREYLDRKPVVDAEFARRFMLATLEDGEAGAMHSVTRWDRPRGVRVRIIAAFEEEGREAKFYYVYDQESLDAYVHSFRLSGEMHIFDEGMDQYITVRPRKILVFEERDAYRKVFKTISR